MEQVIRLDQNSPALEDPEVREAFYDRGGWVDGNVIMSDDVPEDLAHVIVDEKQWGDWVDVWVLDDAQVAELVGIKADFYHDPDAAAEDVHAALEDGDYEWSHKGMYGTEYSTWLVRPPIRNQPQERSPVGARRGDALASPASSRPGQLSPAPPARLASRHDPAPGRRAACRRLAAPDRTRR